MKISVVPARAPRLALVCLRLRQETIDSLDAQAARLELSRSELARAIIETALTSDLTLVDKKDGAG